MIAVDTNIIVRLVAGDDEEQLKSVRQLMSARELFVPLTVLLEAAWVLRSRYGYGRERIVEALANLVSLDGVAVEEPELVTWALDRHRTGSDFADCVHLVASRDAEAFATFDRELAAKAGANPPLPIETLT